MTAERNERYHEPTLGDSEVDLEDNRLGDIDEYAFRAALDSSGYWFKLLGKDIEGRGHYAKEREDYVEVAVLDQDQDVVGAVEIEYGDDPDRRLESYVWEHEWQELTEYGAAWLDE